MPILSDPVPLFDLRLDDKNTQKGSNTEQSPLAAVFKTMQVHKQ